MLTILQVCVGLIIALPLYNAYRIYANYLAARASGLPYVVVPFYEFGPFWTAFGPYLAPVFALLPKRFTGWLRFLQPDWMWHRKYNSYREFNSDLFIVVSGEASVVYVADADVITEILRRRDDFVKPTYMYRVLKIFGENVVTADEVHWRPHRKIAAPSFNERNNLLVWAEAIEKATVMVKSWTDPLPHSSSTSNSSKPVPSPVIRTLADDCMRLALHVISWAGFRQRLAWPKRQSDGAYKERISGDDEGSSLARGHTMSFQYSMHHFLVYIFFILGLPEIVMKYSVFKRQRLAWKAYKEFDSYMNEMVEDKRMEMENDGVVAKSQPQSKNDDIMSALINGLDAGKKEETKEKGVPVLTEREVVGNTFIILVAGHESTANTIMYSVLQLAMHPDIQILLQDELDRILGNKEVPGYEEDYQALAEGWSGAIMNETLRLFPPVVNIPKWTAQKSQPLHYRGKTHLIPAGSRVFLSCIGLHRNPRYWVLSGQSESDARLDDWRPERWILTEEARSQAKRESTQRGEAEGEEGITQPGGLGKDTSRAFFRPYKGSYIPFSDGQRACLGRKFTAVEFVAAMAVIFRKHSVELAVDEENGETWEEVKKRTEEYVDDSRSVLTLKPRRMHQGVGLRCVKRGEERWFPKRK